VISSKKSRPVPLLIVCRGVKGTGVSAQDHTCFSMCMKASGRIGRSSRHPAVFALQTWRDRMKTLCKTNVSHMLVQRVVGYGRWSFATGCPRGTSSASFLPRCQQWERVARGADQEGERAVLELRSGARRCLVSQELFTGFFHFACLNRGFDLKYKTPLLVH
jgi:hypothetical protein